jgi:hypothetical protein
MEEIVLYVRSRSVAARPRGSEERPPAREGAMLRARTLGAVALLVPLLTLSGCAIIVRDDEHHTVDLWGIGRLTTRTTDPVEDRTALVHRTQTAGLTIDVGGTNSGLSVGLAEHEDLTVFDADTSLNFESSSPSLLQWTVGSKPKGGS